jgi:sugar lactone lactonase YvrE
MGFTAGGNRCKGFAAQAWRRHRAMVLVLTCGVAVLAPWRLAAGEGVAGGPKAVCPAGIETVAGFFALGDDGPALEARLKGPAGMAWDAAGNLYIADSQNHRVRMVTREGVIRTIAGTGVAGSSGDGGPATEASLLLPVDLAFDARGNLYIAEAHGHRIRKVSTEGVISTVAGTGARGYSGDGGPATEAALDTPQGIALDAAGTLYIADTGNHRVRRVDAEGRITTIAGNGEDGSAGDGGPAVEAQLSDPSSVALDAAGNLYIADSWANRIRKVTPEGRIVTVAGTGARGFSGDGGPAAEAWFSGPACVRVDAAGNLLVADRYNNRVRKISPDGRITTIAGNGYYGAVGDTNGDGGAATAAMLQWPGAVAIAPDGSVYVADTGADRIRRVAADGRIEAAAGARLPAFNGDGQAAVKAVLRYPFGLAVDSTGTLYIADTIHHRVRKVDAGGVIRTVAGTGQFGYSGDGTAAVQAQLASPHHVAVDPTGAIYIADTYNHRIRRVSPEGVITTVAGTGAAGFAGDDGPASAARLNYPFALALDREGNLYVADKENHRIRRISKDGKITTIAGTGAAGYSGDEGPAARAQLDTPSGVAVDASGNVYIADTYNNRIRKVTPDGVIVTVAGTGRFGYAGDGGPATAARLALPMGVVVDQEGNLYIADYLNRRVRRLSPDGTITTVAGDGRAGYSGDDGPATAARLDYPHGVAADASGRLYVSDVGSHVVRRIWLSCQPAPVLAFGGGQGVLEVIRPAGGPRSGIETAADGGPALALDGRGRWLAVARTAEGALHLLREDADGMTETRLPWEPDAGGKPALAASYPAAGRRALVAYRNRDGMLRAGFVDLAENQPGEPVSLEKNSPADPEAVSCADGSLYVLAADEEGLLWSRRWRPSSGWEAWSAGPAEVAENFAAVCGTDQRVYVAWRDRSGQLRLARLNGNRWEGTALIAKETSSTPRLAAGVNGRLYIAYADGDGVLRLAEFLEERQEISAQWNTEKAAPDFALAAAAGSPWLLAWSPDEPVSAYRPAAGKWQLLDPEIRPSGAVAAAPR